MKKLLFGIALILFAIVLNTVGPSVWSLIAVICAVLGLAMAGLECFREDFRALLANNKAASEADASEKEGPK